MKRNPGLNANCVRETDLRPMSKNNTSFQLQNLWSRRAKSREIGTLEEKRDFSQAASQKDRRSSKLRFVEIRRVSQFVLGEVYPDTG
jgi:hypothetical protein